MNGAEKLDGSVIAFTQVVGKPPGKRIFVIHAVHQFGISVHARKVGPVAAVVIVVRKSGLLYGVGNVFIERINAEHAEIARLLLGVVTAFEHFFHICEHAHGSVAVGKPEQGNHHGIYRKIVLGKTVLFIIDEIAFFLIPQNVVDSGLDFFVLPHIFAGKPVVAFFVQLSERVKSAGVKAFVVSYVSAAEDVVAPVAAVIRTSFDEKSAVVRLFFQPVYYLLCGFEHASAPYLLVENCRVARVRHVIVQHYGVKTRRIVMIAPVVFKIELYG